MWGQTGKQLEQEQVLLPASGFVLLPSLLCFTPCPVPHWLLVIEKAGFGEAKVSSGSTGTTAPLTGSCSTR